MAADSGRLREACDPAHTGSGRDPSDSSYRVAKRSSDRSSARHLLPQPSQWHPGVAKESSIGSSARGLCPQASQWHPRGAKRASIGTLVRGPSTEALLGQGRVPKGRKSVPLTGLWSGSRPGLARNPRLQMVLRQGRVTKGTSIGTSARPPRPQVSQWHPRVANGQPTGP